MKKIRLLLAMFGLFGLFALATPVPASAVDVLNEACKEAPESAACAGGGESLTGSDGIIARVTIIVAVVAGVLAVIVMIWGGFMYVTSGGDSGKTTNARNTIIYAAIGLLVIVLAQTLVSFVLNFLE